MTYYLRQVGRFWIVYFYKKCPYYDDTGLLGERHEVFRSTSESVARSYYLTWYDAGITLASGEKLYRGDFINIA